MSLSSLNTEAVGYLQEGCPDKAVSLLLEAFERLERDIESPSVVSDGIREDGEEAAASASNTGNSDTSISGQRVLLQRKLSSADISSEYSVIKEVASTSRSIKSEPTPVRKYQAAVNRAANWRLKQSRSLDDSNQNLNDDMLPNVGSDVSDISQTSLMLETEGGEIEATNNDEETYHENTTASAIIYENNSLEVETTIVEAEPSEDQGEVDNTDVDLSPPSSTPTSPPTSLTFVLQSIPLPQFLDQDPSSVNQSNDVTTTSEQSTSPCPQTTVSDNIFTFYQRAFVLTTLSASSEGDKEEPGQQYDSKQSAVLLYNMAVAHHNYAMYRRDPVAAHREFRTALVFYDMAFSTIQESLVVEVEEDVNEENDNDNDEGDEDFLLLLLAVLNNLGHIHAHWYNYLETQEMLTSLQEILAAIRPPSGEPSAFMDHNNHNRDDFLFFYKNLVVYEEQEFAAAPAA